MEKGISLSPIRRQMESLGFQNTPTYCEFLQMPDGSNVLNESWTNGCLAGWYQRGNVCTPALIVSEERR
jgi:hypothetical protein